MGRAAGVPPDGAIRVMALTLRGKSRPPMFSFVLCALLIPNTVSLSDDLVNNVLALLFVAGLFVAWLYDGDD